MVLEKYFGQCEYFWGWRCVICGEIVDDLILENRKRVQGNRRGTVSKGNKNAAYTSVLESGETTVFDGG